VDVALVDSLFTTMSQHVQKIFIEDAVPSRIGNRSAFTYHQPAFLLTTPDSHPNTQV
jgi:hypothetical protein